MNFFIREFYTRYEGDKGVDYVVLSPRGEAADRVATPLRVAKIIPPKDASPDNPSHFAMMKRWEVIGPAYDAWKKGQEIPEDGTPLGAWSHITPELAAHLKRMGILTVEHVRDMGEDTAAKLPFPDARKMPKLAADFLKSKDKSDAIAENEALKERIAAMEEMMAEMDKPKRGPGRPRKETEAA